MSVEVENSGFEETKNKIERFFLQVRQSQNGKHEERVHG